MSGNYIDINDRFPAVGNLRSSRVPSWGPQLGGTRQTIMYSRMMKSTVVNNCVNKEIEKNLRRTR